MAVDSSGGHPAMDYAAHEQTYAGFLKGAQILTGALVLLLIGMAYFLV